MKGSVGTFQLVRLPWFSDGSRGCSQRHNLTSGYLGLHSAFSPNACAVVSLGENHEVKLRLMQLSIGGFDEQADRGLSTIL